MNKETIEHYIKVAEALSRSYQIKNDLGSTEFALIDMKWFGQDVQCLLSPGTDEIIKDNIKNFNLFSWGALKWPARQAAKDIYNSNQFKSLRNIELPLIGAGHSKGGTEIGAFNEIFGVSKCLLFAPAPFVRPWKKCKNNYILFTDPDDIVHQAGMVNFDIPKPFLHIKGENDHIGKYIKDHRMVHWIDTLKKLRNKTSVDYQKGRMQGMEELSNEIRNSKREAEKEALLTIADKSTKLSNKLKELRKD